MSKSIDSNCRRTTSYEKAIKINGLGNEAVFHNPSLFPPLRWLLPTSNSLYIVSLVRALACITHTHQTHKAANGHQRVPHLHQRVPHLHQRVPHLHQLIAVGLAINQCRCSFFCIYLYITTFIIVHITTELHTKHKIMHFAIIIHAIPQN